MFTLKYNRTTNHIEGLTVRTNSNQTSEQANVSGVVAYSAQNACGSVTRSGSRMATSRSFETVSEALAYAEASSKATGRKLCKVCKAAAEAMIEEAAPAEETDIVACMADGCGARFATVEESMDHNHMADPSWEKFETILEAEHAARSEMVGAAFRETGEPLYVRERKAKNVRSSKDDLYRLIGELSPEEADAYSGYRRRFV